MGLWPFGGGKKKAEPKEEPVKCDVFRREPAVRVQTNSLYSTRCQAVDSAMQAGDATSGHFRTAAQRQGGWQRARGHEVGGGRRS
jgi:hypothetical protein